ncbi:MAG: ATP synthase F1 subunit delta [Deltaproteobacteria bacterium]|nr:ATP synthase F1 subunit delta [Deltaproteobacteria bacterium]
MSIETVASRYAHALLEIGVETNSLQPITEQMAELAKAYQTSAELRAVISNPLVSLADREAVLTDICAKMGVLPVVKNTLRMLVQRKRMAILPAMSRSLRKLADEHAKVVRAEVSSAKALSDDYVRRLQSEIEKLTGRKVLLERKVDPALIAGVVTRVGDLVIDGSLRTRLVDLKAQLLSS